MFEIRKGIGGTTVYINGRVSAGSFAKERVSGRRSRKTYSYQLSFFLKEDFLLIASQPIKNLVKQHVEKAEFSRVESLGEYKFPVTFTVAPERGLLSITLGGAKSWDERFNFSRLQEALITSYRLDSLIKVYALGPKTIVQVEVEEPNLFSRVISIVMSDLRSRLRDLLPQVRTHDTTNGLTITFDFPKEVSTACERYLMYFAEFLTDIGIEATSDVKHEAGKVLFTVTPSNPSQALHTIREALDLYLEAAKYPIAVVTDDEDLISIKWKTAVETLHEELSLTRRALQIRTREVMVLEEALEHEYQRAVPHSDHRNKSASDPNAVDREVVIPGILTVKRFEKGPFEVEIPSLVRWIKKHIFGFESDE